MQYLWIGWWHSLSYRLCNILKLYCIVVKIIAVYRLQLLCISSSFIVVRIIVVLIFYYNDDRFFLSIASISENLIFQTIPK